MPHVLAYISSLTCTSLRNFVKMLLDEDGALQGDTRFPGSAGIVPILRGRRFLLLDTDEHLREQETF